MTTLNLENKLAKALAFRKYQGNYPEYCRVHEYDENHMNALDSWWLCRYYSEQYKNLTVIEIEELLDLYCRWKNYL